MIGVRGGKHVYCEIRLESMFANGYVCFFRVVTSIVAYSTLEDGAGECRERSLPLRR